MSSHQLMNRVEVMELSKEKERTDDECNEEEETDPDDNKENEDGLDIKQEPFWQNNTILKIRRIGLPRLMKKLDTWLSLDQRFIVSWRQ